MQAAEGSLVAPFVPEALLRFRLRALAIEAARTLATVRAQLAQRNPVWGAANSPPRYCYAAALRSTPKGCLLEA